MRGGGQGAMSASASSREKPNAANFGGAAVLSNLLCNSKPNSKAKAEAEAEAATCNCNWRAKRFEPAA